VKWITSAYCGVCVLLFAGIHWVQLPIVGFVV